jgi:hypothetical protein
MNLPPINRYSVSYVKFLDYSAQKYPGKRELLKNGLLQETLASIEDDRVLPVKEYLLEKFIEFRLGEIKETYAEPMKRMEYYGAELLDDHIDWTTIRWELFDGVRRRYEQRLPPMASAVRETFVIALMWDNGYLAEGGPDRWGNDIGYHRDTFLEECKTLWQLYEWITREVKDNGTVFDFQRIIPMLDREYCLRMRQKLDASYESSKRLVQYCAKSLIHDEQLEHLSRMDMDCLLFNLIRFGTGNEMVSYLERNVRPRDHTEKIQRDTVRDC